MVVARGSLEARFHEEMPSMLAELQSNILVARSMAVKLKSWMIPGLILETW